VSGRFLDQMRAALAPAGLNLYGVIARASYDAEAPPALRTDALHPPAQSIVVVGSGGRAHWERFLAYVALDPAARLGRRRHPLDEFCAETFAAQSELFAGCRVFFPTVFSPASLDFVKLGELAGLGRRSSQIRILVGQSFGPWFALRAAVFTPEALAPSPAAPDLCEGCAAPCLEAAGPGPLAGESHRRARSACIVAPEERYHPLEQLYHYDRPAGRRALCEEFGVRDEGPA